jgi:capsid protein
VQNSTDSLNQFPTAIGSSVRNEVVNDNKSQVTFHTKGTNTLYLNKGEVAQLMQSADIGSNWGILVETELRKIAVVSEILLHELTGETGKMSMSAMIGLLVQSRKRLEFMINVYTIPLRERPIAESFQQLASVYNKRALTAIPHFQLPMWRGLDDLSDAQADVLELQNGLALYEDKLAERGLTVDKVIADREGLKDLEQYGIQFTALNASPSMQQAGKNQQANTNTTSN